MIRNIVIEHPRYLEAFDGLADFHFPVKGGLHAVGTLSMLVGDSRAGKTFVCKRYAKGFPQTVGEEGMVMPVVYAEMPGEYGGGHRGVLTRIAEALDFPFSQRMNNAALTTAIERVLVQRKTQLLMLDEFEQLFREKSVALAGFGRGLLRKFLNLQTLSVVCVGLTETYAAIRQDPQLVGRGGLPRRVLRAYEWDKVDDQTIFRQVCDAFDQQLPFNEHSGLGRTDMAHRLYWVCEGNIGRLKVLIDAAAAFAINDAAERISIEHFARAYDDRMEIGTNFNPFRHALALLPKKEVKTRGPIKSGGTKQVFSKARQQDLADGF